MKEVQCQCMKKYKIGDKEYISQCPYCDYADFVKIKKIGENIEILILSILPEIRRRYDTQT